MVRYVILAFIALSSLMLVPSPSSAVSRMHPTADVTLDSGIASVPIIPPPPPILPETTEEFVKYYALNRYSSEFTGTMRSMYVNDVAHTFDGGFVVTGSVEFPQQEQDYEIFVANHS